MNLIHLNKITAHGYREEGDPETTVPVSVNPFAIRSFNPRRNNAPGTRLTFTDGGGYAVSESYSDVVRYIEHGEPPAAREPIALVANGGEDA